MDLVIRSSTLAHRPPARLWRAPALGLFLLLMGGCSRPDVGFGDSSWAPTGGGVPWLPFSGQQAGVTVDSLTAQRVRGGESSFAPLTPEPGNVWPEQEAPRPTLLGSADEAMRNVPEYRPSLIEGAPPARSPVPTVQDPPVRRGSGGVSQDLPPPRDPQRIPAQQSFAPAPPPPARTEGSVLTDPSGRPATVTGQAGRVQGVTQPGIGGGAVIRDGNVETWIGPDGQARTRLAPLR